MEGGKRSRIQNLRPLPLASGTHGHGHHGSLQPENFASVDPSPGLISMRMDTSRDEITVDDSMNHSMDQSLPPSPATSTREGDMSVSDLTSIGFDSNMSSDLHSQGFLSDKSAAPSTPLKPREARDETDPLAALLREPQFRALLNIVKFMREQGSGAGAASARQKAGGKFKVLTAACSTMVTLALQRDVLSRASALRSFVAGIPAQVPFPHAATSAPLNTPDHASRPEHRTRTEAGWFSFADGSHWWGGVDAGGARRPRGATDRDEAARGARARLAHPPSPLPRGAPGHLAPVDCQGLFFLLLDCSRA